MSIFFCHNCELFRSDFSISNFDFVSPVFQIIPISVRNFCHFKMKALVLLVAIVLVAAVYGDDAPKPDTEIPGMPLKLPLTVFYGRF